MNPVFGKIYFIPMTNSDRIIRAGRGHQRMDHGTPDHPVATDVISLMRKTRNLKRRDFANQCFTRDFVAIEKHDILMDALTIGEQPLRTEMIKFPISNARTVSRRNRERCIGTAAVHHQQIICDTLCSSQNLIQVSFAIMRQYIYGKGRQNKSIQTSSILKSHLSNILRND